MQDLSRSILKSSLWVFATSSSQRIIGFFVSIIMARLLVPEDFGLVVTISVFTGLMGFVAGGGMGDALVRSKELMPGDFSAVFTTQLIICLAIYAGFYFVAPSFASWMQDPRYELLLRVSALTFLLRPAMNVAGSKISREMRFRDRSLVRLFGFIVGSATGIALALRGFGPWALILSGLISAVAMLPVMIIVSGWLPHIRFDREAILRLAPTGLKFSGNHILDYFRRQIPNLFVSRTMGPAVTGLFNRASSLSMMPMQLLVGSLYEPLLRGLATTQDDKESSKRLFLRAITLVAFYSMPIYVTLWWIADPLIPFVYGENWRGTVEPLRILALSGLFLVNSPSGALIAAQNRLGKELLINIEVLVLLVLGCFALRHHGAVGVAAAVLAMRLYGGARLYALAASTVGASWSDLVKALIPCYSLNLLLFLGLWWTNNLLRNSIYADSPIIHLFVMTLVAGVALLSLISILPWNLTKTELSRWKKWLNVRRLDQKI